jgi:hypothetical protein
MSAPRQSLKLEGKGIYPATRSKPVRHYAWFQASARRAWRRWELCSSRVLRSQ